MEQVPHPWALLSFVYEEDEKKKRELDQQIRSGIESDQHLLRRAAFELALFLHAYPDDSTGELPKDRPEAPEKALWFDASMPSRRESIHYMSGSAVHYAAKLLATSDPDSPTHAAALSEKLATQTTKRQEVGAPQDWRDEILLCARHLCYGVTAFPKNPGDSDRHCQNAIDGLARAQLELAQKRSDAADDRTEG